MVRLRDVRATRFLTHFPPVTLSPLERTDSTSSWTCPSCGAVATTRYCGECGEDRFAVTSAGTRVRGPRRSFAARLLASLRALASPPGRLTADWIAGRRVGYLPPLSLFLWINVAFFLVQSASGLGVLTWPLHVHLADDSFGWLATKLLARHRPDALAPGNAFADIFNALEAVHAKSLVIVMVPAFAAALGVLLIDRRLAFRHAMIFSMHFFAFTLIWLCALFPMAAIVLVVSGFKTVPQAQRAIDIVITALEAAVLAWYLHVALGTVFRLSALRRAASVVALIAALFYILKAYHFVVFVVTLYSR